MKNNEFSGNEKYVAKYGSLLYAIVLLNILKKVVYCLHSSSIFVTIYRAVFDIKRI